jgi:hypothetical protein
MGYLICNDCKQYYELQPDEKPEDFSNKCSCDGILIYKENLDFFNPNNTEDEIDNQTNKNQYNNTPNTSRYSFSGDLNSLKNLINTINDKINPMGIAIGLVFSIIVLFVSSIIFSSFMVGLLGITIYGILTILGMTLIGGFVTGFIGSNDIEEGGINGGFLTLILLIAVGLLLGLIIFVTIGIYATVLHTLGSLGNIPGATTALKGSSGNSLNSIGNSILNIFYAIITIILSFIFGILGGSLGVIIKERFGIQL